MRNYQWQSRFLLIAALGAVFSVYLLYHHVEVTEGFQIGKSFCSLTENIDCDKVAESKYAELFGVPIASIGLLFYLALIVFVVLAKPERGVSKQEFVNVLLAISYLTIPPTLFLAYVSVAKIKSLCMFCAFLYACNLSLAGLSTAHPEREQGLVQSFFGGLKRVLSFLLPLFSGAGNKRGYFVAAASWISLVVIGGVIYKVPEVLVTHHFMPRAKQTGVVNDIDSIVEIWSKQPHREIAIRAGGTPDERDYLMGEASAVLTVAEFSDFACPYCERASRVLKTFYELYPEEVRIVYKNFPLDANCNRFLKQQLHEYSCKAALVARCAGAQEQMLFWEMHDLIFMLAELNDDSLESLPGELGLDLVRFQQCIAHEGSEKKLLDDIELGASLGARGTPAIFVNGKLVGLPLNDPRLSRQVLEAILDRERNAS